MERSEKPRRERKSRSEAPAKESTKREASKRPDDVDSRPGAAAREASGDDLHSALGRSLAKDAIAPLTACKAMSKKPEGGEVRLRSVERAAASPIEGHVRTLPEASVVDAFLAMSSNREFNRQVREDRNARRLGVGGSRSWRTPMQRVLVGVPVRPPGGPLGRRRHGIPEDVGVARCGETAAGDPRGIVTGTVRRADATGGGAMIADRLIDEGCGR